MKTINEFAEEVTENIFRLAYSQVKNYLIFDHTNKNFQINILHLSDNECRKLNEMCADLANEVSIYLSFPKRAVFNYKISVTFYLFRLLY